MVRIRRYSVENVSLVRSLSPQTQLRNLLKKSRDRKSGRGIRSNRYRPLPWTDTEFWYFRNLEPLSENSSWQDRDNTIKKALYQLDLRGKVLVVQFRKVTNRNRIRDVVLPNENRGTPPPTSNNAWGRPQPTLSRASRPAKTFLLASNVARCKGHLSQLPSL